MYSAYSAGSGSSSSLTEKTYSTLRTEILACRLRPGQPLRIQQISARLAVSPGAVREALSRLSAEEFVVSRAQKGFRVAPVQEDDLEDLIRTRIEIESMCLRRAIEVGGIEWESALVAACHRLNRITAPLDSDEWAHTHALYHLALVEACDSAWLLRVRALLFAQSERYRRLALSRAEGYRDVKDEHRVLTDAALARDANRACALLANHLSMTAAMVRSRIQEWRQSAGDRFPEGAGHSRIAL